MPDDVSSAARFERALVAILLAAFFVAGLLRLSPACLLEPDSAEYLVTARALATARGYTDLHRPGAPAHVLRPPGLSILLAPVALVRPYDVRFAKIVLLALTTLAFAALWLLARRLAGPVGGIVALLLAASSPYALLHGSEIVSEGPYLLLVFAILAWIARGEPEVSWRNVALLSAATAFLPWVRAVGLAFVTGLLVWSLASRARRRFLLASAAGVVAWLVWSLRNRAVGAADTYLGQTAGDLDRLGMAGFLAKIARALWTYLRETAEIAIPGLSPGNPFYERALAHPAPSLGLPEPLVVAAGLAVVAAAAYGCFARRHGVGLLAGVYAAAYLGLLAIYPFHSERLVWPLVPLVWVFAAAGIAAIPAKRVLAIVAAIVGVGISSWQIAGSAALVSSARAARSEGVFFETAAPPPYFADWQEAGRAIAADSPSHVRVLTRHTDIGFTARRWIETVRFEEMPVAYWRRRLAEHGARYVVAPDALFGRDLPRAALHGDPAYTYTLIHRERGVSVFRVEPNRAGIARPIPSGDIDADVAACRDAIAAFPDRPELKRRLGELLAEAGRQDEAALALRGSASGGGDVRVHLTLARLLIDLERWDEALEVLGRAARLPEAGDFPQSIAGGRRLAEDGRASARSDSPEARAQRHVVAARRALADLDVGSAERHAAAAERLVPQDRPEVALLRGDLLERAGDLEAARAAFERAAALGDERARRRAARAGATLAIEREGRATDPRLLVELAATWAGEGFPGRALDLLERFGAEFPGEAEIPLRLGDLWLHYGWPEKAEPLYREALHLRPGDGAASRGLAACAAANTPPSY